MPLPHLVAVLGRDRLGADAAGRLPRALLDEPDLDELPGGAGTVVAHPVRALGDDRLHVLAEPGWDASGLPQARQAAADLAEPPQTRQAIARAAAEFAGQLPRPSSRPDWYAAGWLGDVDRWVAEQLAPRGLRVTTPAQVLRMWELSAVARYRAADTSGAERAVVVKASCEHFAQEPVLTAAADRLGTGGAPRVLGVDPDRRVVLMEAFTADPSLETDRAARDRTAVALARLQLASHNRIDTLLADGCPDRRLGPTVEAFQAVVADGAEIGALSADERAALAALVPRITAQLDELFGSGLPMTLVHGDLHPGNVAVTAATDPVLYDWSDGCVSHPLLDISHLGTHRSDDPPGMTHGAWAAYAQVWHDAGWELDVARLAPLARLADRVFQVVSYEGIMRSVEPGITSGMAGVQAALLRRLLAEPR